MNVVNNKYPQNILVIDAHTIIICSFIFFTKTARLQDFWLSSFLNMQIKGVIVNLNVPKK